MENKRSQMEIFGLAVIVVLITIGFFIFVSLRSQNPPQEIKKDYIVDQTATNFINSLVNVDVVECYDTGYTIAKLLKYCATGEDIDCGGLTACALVADTMDNITNRTLLQQGYHYRLYTKGLNLVDANGNLSEYVNANMCGDNDPKGMRGTFPVSKYPVPGDVLISLDICK